MSILYILILPFYYLFKNTSFNTNKKLFLFLIFYTSIGYFLALQIQDVVLLYATISDKDVHYLSTSLGTSLVSRIPIMFQHILMLIALIVWNNKLPKTNIIKFIRLLVIFDIIVAPVSVVFGMWRALEYLYVPRLILWAYLIPCMTQSYSVSSKKIVLSTLFLVFSFWLFFRINQEWDAAGLTPYKLIFF